MQSLHLFHMAWLIYIPYGLALMYRISHDLVIIIIVFFSLPLWWIFTSVAKNNEMEYFVAYSLDFMKKFAIFQQFLKIKIAMSKHILNAS